MIRLAIIGGVEIYHARAFGALINGLAPSQSWPQDWPQFPQCVEDARITAVWDEDYAAAQKLAEVFGIEHVPISHEAVLPHCDGVIIADDLTGNHCRHAPFFLQHRIPTFVDKPLAPDSQTAATLLEIAAAHNAPLMSGSALRYAAETQTLRADPDALGRIKMAVAVGPGELLSYGIHPLELAHSILGGGIQSAQNIGDEKADIVKLTYQDGRVLMLMVSRVIGYGFEISLFGEGVRQRIEVTDATAFYANQLRQVAQMAREKKAPAPIADALEIIRALEAARESLQLGGAPVLLVASAK